jgi:hypothetical protein
MVQRINDVNYGEAFEQTKRAAEAALSLLCVAV